MLKDKAFSIDATKSKNESDSNNETEPKGLSDSDYKSEPKNEIDSDHKSEPNDESNKANKSESNNSSKSTRVRVGGGGQLSKQGRLNRNTTEVNNFVNKKLNEDSSSALVTTNLNEKSKFIDT